MKITKAFIGKFGPCLLEGDGDDAKFHGTTEEIQKKLSDKVPCEIEPVIDGKKIVSFTMKAFTEGKVTSIRAEEQQRGFNIAYTKDVFNTMYQRSGIIQLERSDLDKMVLDAVYVVKQINKLFD